MSENNNLQEAQQNVETFTYEIQLWTLQDNFVSTLKWADIEVKGQLQSPEIQLSDDGTREFSFSIPKFYYDCGNKTFNPMWYRTEKSPIEANMHKLKVIFNKNTNDEQIEEFLVTSVVETHSQDNIVIEVSAEGLAFHELGKIGYKISLSADDFNEVAYTWFQEGMAGEEPLNNINYWNDIVFKNADGDWKYDWTYEVCMDWSSFSQAGLRDSDVIYEDEYVSSWSLDENNKFVPAEIHGFDEKYRYVEAEESNIYNITQDIAKEFGVFCRYEYDHDENYKISGKRVVYYNNYLEETHTSDDVVTTHLDLTYPYSSSQIKRTIDSADIVTKMYVRTVDSNANDTNIISIMDVEANKSREDYILNFDYLYEIGTISDAQYEMIEPYEKEMHRINTELSTVEKQIMILENELTDVQAKITLCKNAIQLDQEQINNAQARENALTGGTGYIPISEVNAEPCLLKYDNNGNMGYYVNITIEGLDPSSLKLYAERDYRTNVLSNQITEYKCVYENNNLVRLQNIVIRQPEPASAESNESNESNESSSSVAPGTIITDTITRIYITGMYDPKLYWENIESMWVARLNEDRAELEKAEERETTILWYLYGRRADFGKADDVFIEDSDAAFIVARVGEKDDPHSPTVGNSRVWGLSEDAPAEDYHFEDSDNYTPDLYWTYESLLKEKQKLINYFEQLMGPALREGYWQPEDYADYGDKYLDSFTIGNTTASNAKTPNYSELLSFSWDGDKIFNGEEEILYQSSVSGKYEQYLVIDLSEHLDAISTNMEELAFIYYDYTAVTNLEEMIAKQDGVTEPREQWTTQYYDSVVTRVLKLKDHNDIIRAFMVGSECEYGFIKDSAKEDEYIPVLILTGSKLLTQDEINFITSANTHASYKPCIGYYKATVSEENDEVVENVESVVTDLTFICGKNDHTDINYNIGDSIDSSDKEYYSIKRVYPRIFIHSLKLNTSDDQLLINLNDNPLENYEDYYILVDERGDTKETYRAGYNITLKPEKIIFYGDKLLNIDISFVLSNADVAIYLDALKISKENAYPKVSYEVELCALDYNLLRTAYNKLNYIVHINDIDLQLRDVYGYISSITIPLDTLWETSVEIKNYETKFEDLFSTIVAQTEAMQKNEHVLYNLTGFMTNSGTINSNILQQSIQESNISYSFNQGGLTIDEKHGIQATSNDGVVAFRSDGIFSANSKNTDGDWNWNSCILPSGINANLITVGQLDTNKIRIFAGDKVQFQLNGEGLFAYKAFFPSDSDTDSDMLNPSQYAVFNQDGLFLTAKKDSYLSTYSYSSTAGRIIETESSRALNQDVDRVEISWKGLILRNNANDIVFYADTNGNLHLEGIITATGGRIGGWNIQNNCLESIAGYNMSNGETWRPYVILNGNPSLNEPFLQMLDSNNKGFIFDRTGMTFTGELNNVEFITKGINGSCTIDTDGSVVISVANQSNKVLDIQYGLNNTSLGYIYTQIIQTTINSQQTYIPYITITNQTFNSDITIYDGDGEQWYSIKGGATYSQPASIAIGGGRVIAKGIIDAPDGILTDSLSCSYINLGTSMYPVGDPRTVFTTQAHILYSNGNVYLDVIGNNNQVTRYKFVLTTP